MRIPVVLSLRGTQRYQEQEPDVIELVTDGIMVRRTNGWDISYEESELTGMEGVLTTFRITPEKITLRRSGKLRSEMVFQQDQCHESLYQMEFGALMIRVCAEKMIYDLTEAGGTVDLVYSIEIENTAMGHIDYHLEVKAK